MSATHDLMDRVKERRGLTSDSALARMLGTTQATVSNWRQGTRHPQPHYIETMSKALGERAIVWALRIQAERDAKVDPTNSKVWLRWADEIGKSAAAILLVFGLAVYTPKAESHGLGYFSHSSRDVYIMSTWARRLRRAFKTLAGILTRRHGVSYAPSPMAA
jgi:transcriptional regulator with XRE-family HTH domain